MFSQRACAHKNTHRVGVPSAGAVLSLGVQDGESELGPPLGPWPTWPPRGEGRVGGREAGAKSSAVPRMSCTWPLFRLEGRPSRLFIRASSLSRSIPLDVACSPLVSVAGLEASVGGESLVGAASGGAAVARTPVLLLAPSRAGPFGLATMWRQVDGWILVSGCSSVVLISD